MSYRFSSRGWLAHDPRAVRRICMVLQAVCTASILAIDGWSSGVAAQKLPVPWQGQAAIGVLFALWTFYVRMQGIRISAHDANGLQITTGTPDPETGLRMPLRLGKAQVGMGSVAACISACYAGASWWVSRPSTTTGWRTTVSLGFFAKFALDVATVVVSVVYTRWIAKAALMCAGEVAIVSPIAQVASPRPGEYRSANGARSESMVLPPYAPRESTHELTPLAHGAATVAPGDAIPGGISDTAHAPLPSSSHPGPPPVSALSFPTAKNMETSAPFASFHPPSGESSAPHPATSPAPGSALYNPLAPRGSVLPSPLAMSPNGDMLTALPTPVPRHWGGPALPPVGNIHNPSQTFPDPPPPYS
jgi:hypothetical protein